MAFRGRHLLVFDAAAVGLSFFVSFALRFDAPSVLFADNLRRFAWVIPVLVLSRVAVFIAVGLYQRVWRYASVAELQALLVAVGTSSVVAYGFVYGLGELVPPAQGFPRSIPIIDSLVTLMLIGGLRFSFMVLGFGRRGLRQGPNRSRTLIIGAGSAGVGVARQILSDRDISLELVGFVDDEETRGHRLLGMPVVGRISELQTQIRNHRIGTVLLALPTADGPTLRKLVRITEREGATALTVPSLSEVLAGRVTSPLREIEVDDLLRRAPAKIDLAAVTETVTGRSILVTGAGGSIGSELARQLLRYGPRRLYLLGRGENSIYEINEELSAARAGTELVPTILDVRDARNLARFLLDSRPDVVFHAAAHKHVSFMERFPEQAVATNVIGTLNLLNAAIAAEVSSLVFVSTDKAVRPASVMGATKRIGELAVRDAARRSGKRFVVVRFGNVLSSRGSVLPRFRRQLAAGGPLTVTHPDVTRYFMTISEAVQLILQASVIGRAGDTLVLDMGAPVRIDDLARDLIERHGLVPGSDIRLEYTGLKPGEKMHEDLFLPEERPQRTPHDGLWFAQDRESRPLSADEIELLRSAAHSGEATDIHLVLKRIVPEYDPVTLSTAPAGPAT
jgi:FlaA1/EpsC-like NDP-sugar epimerase